MKNTKKIITAFCIVFVMVNFLVGVFVISSLIHELSHKQDFKDVPKYSDGICALNFPDNFSDGWNVAYYYYSYSPTKENTEMVNNIKSYTEFKAYTLDSLYAVFCLVIGIFLIVFLFRNGTKEVK